ncbi:MAG TPA: sodium:proton antiporter [Fimbriimonadaceae bacterium]|nr:sodium:proton antiporter [Fimbriimonadaceae bacterium]
MVSAIERMEILLLVAAVVSMIARRFRLPYTVGLVFAGIIMAAFPAARVELTKDLIFTAFLPPLIFEAALQMKWKELKREMPVTLTLATIGVLLSAALIACGIHYGLGLDWSSSILVAVLISATDPVAVVAMFRDLGIRGRLGMLMESESLFNDGTAAVLFVIALASATGQAPTAIGVVGSFLKIALGGIVGGALVGGAALLLVGRTKDHLLEITFTTIAAYASFLLAEHFQASGVLATLTAGMLVGNVGVLSERGEEAVETFWEYIGFVANSLIFLLIGLSLDFRELSVVWLPALLLVGLMMGGRALAVYACCAAFLKSRFRVSFREQHVLFWGGLRGALALALVLGLPERFPNREYILNIVFAVVAFSVVVQGLTIAPLLRGLGICDPRAKDC